MDKLLFTKDVSVVQIFYKTYYVRYKKTFLGLRMLTLTVC